MTTTQTPADIKLLELPEARQYMVGFGPGDIADMFTAEQMQAYALACVEADRLNFEKALAELDNEPIGQGSDANDVTYYEIFTDKIRRILRRR